MPQAVVDAWRAELRELRALMPASAQDLPLLRACAAGGHSHGPLARFGHHLPGPRPRCVLRLCAASMKWHHSGVRLRLPRDGVLEVNGLRVARVMLRGARPHKKGRKYQGLRSVCVSFDHASSPDESASLGEERALMPANHGEAAALVET